MQKPRLKTSLTQHAEHQPGMLKNPAERMGSLRGYSSAAAMLP